MTHPQVVGSVTCRGRGTEEAESDQKQGPLIQLINYLSLLQQKVRITIFEPVS